MKRGWFADIDTEAPESHQWQPCFETRDGHVPCFAVWFSTKAECEAWIRDTILGHGMLDDA